MAYKTISLSVANRIATITITREDKLNALNAEVFEELTQVVDVVREQGDIGGAIITGAGRAFIAGADIGELESIGGMGAKALSRRGQLVFNRIESSPKPVIAAVNGFALGGGCELAMACHLRIASESAKFGQPEAKLGLIPGYGGTQRLPRLIGKGRALQLLLTGEIIDANEAFRIGLVNRVVAAADLLKSAEAMLTQMLANAPLAIAACIETVNRGYDLSQGDALSMEATAFGLLASTDDKREGTRAFLDKRPAKFTGT